MPITQMVMVRCIRSVRQMETTGQSGMDQMLRLAGWGEAGNALNSMAFTQSQCSNLGLEKEYSSS